MKRSRFSEEQIIGILKEAEAEPVKTVCARHNVSQGTYYQWKNKYGGMEVEEARRLRALEARTRDSNEWWPIRRCRSRSSKR
jgi:putative transposase